MANVLKAVPTVFGGVKFRSKSEAIVANALCQVPQLIWVYEPEIVGFSFAVDFMCMISNGKGYMRFLMEYKPSKPSESYIEKCICDFNKFASMIDKPESCLGFWIVWGSPFKDEPLESIAIHRFVNEHGLQDDGWVARMLMECGWEEAKEYRFDLRNG
jgi:hypothetical protein